MSSQTFFFILLGLVALSRLFELAVSRGRVKSLEKKARPELAYFAMIAVHVLLFVLPPIEVVVLARSAPLALMVPMLILVLGSTVLRIWCIRLLGPSWNTRGVVSSEVPIVTSGPYHYIRHPNYLAVITEIAALPLVHGAWISSLVLTLLNGFVLAQRIPREEEDLSSLKGYTEAFKALPRLIPGMRAPAGLGTSAASGT